MNDFMCPHCRGHLRVGDNIIFKIKNKQKETGLLLLSPQIGNYSSLKHHSFKINEGEDVDFSCPLCSSDLKSDIHINLVNVLMVDDKGEEYNVYFSKIKGEHSTYFTKGEEVGSTGVDAGKYTFFKVGDKFIRYLKI
jgi:hypothetical protein